MIRRYGPEKALYPPRIHHRWLLLLLLLLLVQICRSHLSDHLSRLHRDKEPGKCGVDSHNIAYVHYILGKSCMNTCRSNITNVQGGSEKNNLMRKLQNLSDPLKEFNLFSVLCIGLYF